MNNDSFSGRQLVTERIVDAPKITVWEAWTKEEHLRQWYGPNGFSITTESFDFREGGTWKFVMHGPDGRDYPNVVIYTKIVPKDLIEHDHGDGEGKIHFKATVQLEETDGKTKITLSSVFATKEELEYVMKEHGAAEGAKQTLGRLSEYVLKML